VSLPSSVMVGQDRPVFSTESDLVVVHATIKDRGGAYVTGLTRDAFAILEDGRPQNAQLFTGEDAPVTVGLLIDSSGSMQPNRERVIAAAAAFAKASHPNDELFALAFNDSVLAALPPTAPFTSDVAVLQEALTNTLKHADALHASVLVRYGPGTLDVEVVDDGRGATVEGAERGHGIIGMRERVALFGGDLRVGPAANGGFGIHARIPLEESES